MKTLKDVRQLVANVHQVTDLVGENAKFKRGFNQRLRKVFMAFCQENRGCGLSPRTFLTFVHNADATLDTRSDEALEELIVWLGENGYNFPEARERIAAAL